MMRAIADIDGRLTLVDAPRPVPGPGEVRISVRATAVNRADLIQRSGHYRPPPGASPILGLECSGVIESLGPEVTEWAVGDRVCALLSGGGYATELTVPAAQLLPAGDLSFEVAAALPEALCTVHDALVTQAALQPGERVLLHAGASGIGTTAIQLCRELGNPCFVTVGSSEKVAACVSLGAKGGADRHAGDWSKASWLADGVDVVLDPVGAGYISRDLTVLNTGGRIVLIGLMGGRSEPIDLGRMLIKRLKLLGSVLRSRTADEKAAVVRAVREGPWKAVLAGRLHPIIHQVFPLHLADEAHAIVRSNGTTGKVVLTVDDGSRQLQTVDAAT